VCFAGEAEQIAGAVNVGAIHGVGVADPKTVVGGYVDDGIATLERGCERLRIGKIADDRVAFDALKVGEIAGPADQEAQVRTLGG
jgi:hypothetical protein